MAKKGLKISVPNGKEKVTVICYGQKQVMTREEAIKKYFEAMCCCEGSEQERYVHIYQMLMEGYKTCYDI